MLRFMASSAIITARHAGLLSAFHNVQCLWYELNDSAVVIKFILYTCGRYMLSDLGMCVCNLTNSYSAVN